MEGVVANLSIMELEDQMLGLVFSELPRIKAFKDC